MSEKPLKFNNIRVNKKEFYKSKQPVDLISVNLDQIVVSDKFKHSYEGFKYFTQMSGYIKYFENGPKNMSFLIKDDEVRDKNPKKLGCD